MAVREVAREDTEKREYHSSTRVQEWRRGAHIKGALQRVDVGRWARATPTPPGRYVVRSRVQGQGSLPGRGSQRAHMIAQASISERDGRKGIRQLRRGAHHMRN
jgi:hypothetical protein